MELTRRELCVGLAAVGAQAVLGCSSKGSSGSSGAPANTAIRFDHGVASFDPSSEGALLWTRVSGRDDPVDLQYVVARDPELHEIVREGPVKSDPDADQTVVAEIKGLDAGATYFYAFSGAGATTATARFRTIPSGHLDTLRLGIVCCSNYGYGYFAAYAEMAKRNDIDAVLHLGDYIYEYARGTYDDEDLPRPHEPAHEALTLQDYRTRYAQYRRDPDLQELHRHHSMLCIWDDHEFADGSYLEGATNHQSEEGAWSARREAATKACFEWVPRRRDGTNIYRSVRFGDLADLVLLDTRMNGRDKQPGLLTASVDPGRQLLGAEQEAWLAATLEESADDDVPWRVIGQQVMVAPVVVRGQVINVDQWDGYPAQRARFVDMIDGSGDCVVLTGDIHSSWAMDVPRDAARYDPISGNGSVCVEFVSPGVTSPAVPGLAGAIAEVVARRLVPHVKWGDVQRRGFMIVDINRDRVQADWFHLEDVTARTRQANYVTGYLTRAGDRHLVAASGQLATRPGPKRAP